MSPIYIVPPPRFMTVKQFLAITLPISLAGALALLAAVVLF